jgi:hypothetical protein
VSSILVRFPDGTKEFRYPEKELEEGDIVWHDGARFRVVSISADAGDKPIAHVEPESPSIGELLQSEEGAIHLAPIGG